MVFNHIFSQIPDIDHSCADVTITGNTPIQSFPLNSQPDDWPYVHIPSLYYGDEFHTWKNGWLQDLPANYSTLYDNFDC